MERIPKSGEFYRHFKDKLYQIITVAEHSEDSQKLVIYQALYGDFKTYARPLEMFVSEVDHEKYPDVKQKYRFERVEFAGDGAKPEAVEFSSAGVKPAVQPEKAKAVGEPEAEALPVQGIAPTISASAQAEAAYEPEAETLPVQGIAPTISASAQAEPADEESPEPGLIEFLDEEDWDMKYNILVSLRDKMTDRLVDNLAVALDVVIPEGPLDARYEQLKICLRTRQKYESQHLR